MNLFQLYIALGFLYSFYIWHISPEEDRQIQNIGDVTNLLIQGVGMALLWPLVGFCNHFWEGPGE